MPSALPLQLPDRCYVRVANKLQNLGLLAGIPHRLQVHGHIFEGMRVHGDALLELLQSTGRQRHRDRRSFAFPNGFAHKGMAGLHDSLNNRYEL
jgi:hypothetical protein